MLLWRTRILTWSLNPLFEEAGADPTLTAWVADSDETALYALQYLRRHNIAVPRDVSLTGFNNWNVAVAHSLTTYDVNYPGLVRAGIDAVLQEHKQDEPEELPGLLIERSTTGGRLDRVDLLVTNTSPVTRRKTVGHLALPVCRSAR